MYKEAFNKAFDEIKSQPYINLQELVINEPASPALIETFEMIAEIRLPQKIKDFYLFANGLKCIWSIKENLPSGIMNKIKTGGQQLDFDYSKPLGAVKILSIQDMLLDNYWKTPFQNPPELSEDLEFSGQSYKLGEFAKKLKLFDVYEVNNDAEAIAMLTEIEVESSKFNLILLENSLSDWRQSNLIDFETYILAICEVRFTIPVRKQLFLKNPGDKITIIKKEDLDIEQLIPALFQ